MKVLLMSGVLIGVLSGCSSGIVSGLFAPTAFFWQVAAAAGMFFGGIVGGAGGLLAGLVSLAVRVRWVAALIAVPLIYLPLLVFGFIMMEGLDRQVIDAFQAYAFVVACLVLGSSLLIPRVFADAT